jgi:hypothetical protein
MVEPHRTAFEIEIGPFEYGCFVGSHSLAIQASVQHAIAERHIRAAE